MAANRESRAANPAPSKTPASGNRSGTANGTDVAADAQVDESPSREVERYTYTDADGRKLFQVRRYEPKRFLQFRWNGTRWVPGLKGVAPVLYRLPEVIAAVAAGKTIYVAEGERDVHTLAEGLGRVATTPRIKQLSDEAAKYRKRAKAAEDSVEQAQKIITELRIENAYVRHAIPVVDDLDAGRKLADFAGVTIDENGNVEGMTEAVNSLLRNYPYLERQPDTRPMAAPGSGGSPVNGRRTGDAASPALLERKYPALRGRR